MKSSAEHVDMLYQKAKDYTQTSVSLYKLQATDATADVISGLVSKASLVLVISTFLLFFNVGLSLYIGSLISSNFGGFFIVSGFYLILAIVIHFMGQTLIENPVSDMIISKLRRKNPIFKNEDEDE